MLLWCQILNSELNSHPTRFFTLVLSLEFAQSDSEMQSMMPVMRRHLTLCSNRRRKVTGFLDISD
jgi:hypothetical protein